MKNPEEEEGMALNVGLHKLERLIDASCVNLS
jgi:hypothetical protein